MYFSHHNFCHLFICTPKISIADCPFELPTLVVGGYSKCAVIWAEKGGKWVEEVRLDNDRTIFDVAWAPGMGRSYHLIATVDRTRKFKVFKIRREGQGNLVLDSVKNVEAPSEVWRIAWNATGTVLATSSETGALDLWRRDFDGDWVSEC